MGKMDIINYVDVIISIVALITLGFTIMQSTSKNIMFGEPKIYNTLKILFKSLFLMMYIIFFSYLLLDTVDSSEDLFMDSYTSFMLMISFIIVIFRYIPIFKSQKNYNDKLKLIYLFIVDIGIMSLITFILLFIFTISLFDLINNVDNSIQLFIMIYLTFTIFLFFLIKKTNGKYIKKAVFEKELLPNILDSYCVREEQLEVDQIKDNFIIYDISKFNITEPVLLEILCEERFILFEKNMLTNFIIDRLDKTTLIEISRDLKQLIPKLKKLLNGFKARVIKLNQLVKSKSKNTEGEVYEEDRSSSCSNKIQ